MSKPRRKHIELLTRKGPEQTAALSLLPALQPACYVTVDMLSLQYEARARAKHEYRAVWKQRS